MDSTIVEVGMQHAKDLGMDKCPAAFYTPQASAAITGHSGIAIAIGIFAGNLAVYLARIPRIR